MSTKQIEVQLEYLLSSMLRPSYLHIVSDPNTKTIHVIVSSNSFRTMKVWERVTFVWELITKRLQDVTSHLIVVQAYTSEEMERIITDIYN